MLFDLSQNKAIPADRLAEPFPWLLAYFCQIYGQASPQRETQVESLHYAYSLDGLKWTAINQNQPVYIPEIKGCLCNIRDPYVARGPDGFFQLLCTEVTEGGCSRSLVYACSYDLIHWEDTRCLPVMDAVSEAKNAWAPEQEVHFPEYARHGSFISLSEDELARLLWRFDFRFLVEKNSYADTRLNVMQGGGS